MPQWQKSASELASQLFIIHVAYLDTPSEWTPFDAQLASQLTPIAAPANISVPLQQPQPANRRTAPPPAIPQSVH